MNRLKDLTINNKCKYSLMELFEEAVSDVCKDLQENPHHRLNSWEYCYNEFGKVIKSLNQKERKLTKKEYEHLSYVLAFYLASFGMYRGSSYLLSLDYKVHVDAIKFILNNEKYRSLYNLNVENIDDNVRDTIFELKEEIKGIYKDKKSIVIKDEKRRDIKKKRNENPTDTQISKVMMGILGCTIAYDNFSKKAINTMKKKDVEINIDSTFSKSSYRKMIKFYKDNFKELEKLRSKLNKNINDESYSQIRFLDLLLWKIGEEITVNEKYHK